MIKVEMPSSQKHEMEIKIIRINDIWKAYVYEKPWFYTYKLKNSFDTML